MVSAPPAQTAELLARRRAAVEVTVDDGTNAEASDSITIHVDMAEPYNIYGGMQDNHSWMGPSRTRHYIGIINDDWRQIGFGDGMYHQVDPNDLLPILFEGLPIRWLRSESVLLQEDGFALALAGASSTRRARVF